MTEVNKVEVINEIAGAVISRLAEYDLDADRDGLASQIEQTLRVFQVASGKSDQGALEFFSTNRQSLVENLSNELLLAIAEERPGSDPYSHVKNIPTPLSIALITATHLNFIVAIAILNKSNFAQQISTVALEFSTHICESAILETMIGSVDLSPLDQPGERLSSGPYIFLSQPALALASRQIRNGLNKIKKGEWVISDGESHVNNFGDNDAMIDRIIEHLQYSDILRARFGNQSNPSNLS